jgi:hypothetical protein
MFADEADLKDARDQLGTVLGFFSRVDAKLSTVLAIDTAMLASLSASVPPVQRVSPWMAIAPVISAGLLVASYVYLYLGGFPNVKGGHHSMVFFKEIAACTESKFIEEYSNQTPDSLRRDVLGQVWRNSEILVEKYRSLPLAFVCMAVGAIPWSISLALFAMSRANVQVVVQHP